MNDDWFSFAKEIEFLRSTDSPNDKMFTIYRTRDSCIEALFEGVVLLPQCSQS